MRQLEGCCNKDAVDTYGTYDGGRAAARGIAFELFVGEILRLDREIELVSASLLGGAAYQAGDCGIDFVALRGRRALLVEAKATTPQTQRPPGGAQPPVADRRPGVHRTAP